VELAIVPGATHLFEEPGALAQVAMLAGNWFTSHLQGRTRYGRG
jgi:putative phosphoribosyl transferase